MLAYPRIAVSDYLQSPRNRPWSDHLATPDARLLSRTTRHALPCNTRWSITPSQNTPRLPQRSLFASWLTLLQRRPDLYRITLGQTSHLVFCPSFRLIPLSLRARKIPVACLCMFACNQT